MARPTTLRDTGRPRPTPRGSFALEPVGALSRYADAINRLAERAVEPNPFFLPEFLAPAIQAFGPRGLKLAIFSDRDEVQFFAPVRASRRGILRASRLTVWTHPYAPLGAPLIDVGASEQIADSLMERLQELGRRLILFPDLPLAGPAAKILRQAASRQGSVLAAAQTRRPILDADATDGAGAFDRMVPAKRQRELGRQLRRLSEIGAVSLMTARSPSEIDAAFTTFATLEASGWKGRRGTAINRSRKVSAFSRSAVVQFAESGRVAIDILRVGEVPAAALIRFDQGGLSVPWKVAYDEGFAAFSPGKQLMCDATRRWLADPNTRRVDPVCEEDNPLMAPLWPDREPYGTLILSTTRWSTSPQVSAALINLKLSAKARIRTLIRGKPRAPAAAVPDSS